MGIESRDWYREKPRPRRSAGTRIALVVGGLIAAVILVAVSPLAPERLGLQVPFGVAERLGLDETWDGFRVRFPGGPSLEIAGPLYARGDPWRAWLGDEATCPGGEDLTAPRDAQTRTMLCLLNFARKREALRPLKLSGVLTRASATKAADIVRCREFEHAACGRPADQVAREVGYGGRWAENLYVAEGPFVVPRVAVDRWLNSSGHRKNLFRPEWRTVGVARRARADVGRIRDGVVWVNQFGVPDARR